MLPIDALPEDWRMYYNGCWMEHPDHGIGLVEVKHHKFYLRLYKNPMSPGSPIEVHHRDLKMWWPEARAVDVGDGHAVYVSRKSSRTMRKSATCKEHYFISYGKPTMSMELAMVRDTNKYVGLAFAKKVLERKLAKSIAITQNIILDRDMNIWFRGVMVGEIKEGALYVVKTYPLAETVAKELGVRINADL